MAYLATAVTFGCALGLVNLVIVLGVVRRLRELHELLAGGVPALPRFEPNMLAAGATVGDFSASTGDGAPVARADLTGSTLVGFLTLGCPACLESLPWFVARAEGTAGGRDGVLAVLAGVGAEHSEMYGRLAAVARVVVEPELGPVAKAFGLTSYPSFALLYDDTVVASDFALERIPETVPG
ncbi:TlpA family protein disulfide reductase [Plantactinospora endophytica]|uniref:Thioredoxin domain-containing protein n=1 Tax=Plantactinospora endophytica TaxID=673535 RepID=A0ABQ4E9A4_9ACTN|nr:hypothetical protein [Plantactinospora endophytica]GIG91315.1 hypothetical protein Pen02_62510 [Plantactinospora endophytica]